MTIEQRMVRMEQQLNNLLQGNDLPARVDSLQSQVQSLRADLEQLTNMVRQVQVQQQVMSTDIEKRMGQPIQTANKATPAPATTPVATAPGTPATKAGPAPQVATATTTAPASAPEPNNQPNVAEEQQIYQTAYNLIKSKKYDDAVTTLQSMLKKYPSGQFASNAHYWLGELYGLMAKPELAANEFNAVVNNYADSPRVADAQLKLGLIFASEAKWSDAKAAFRKVINHYPGTASSRLASEQLKQLRHAGH